MLEAFLLASLLDSVHRVPSRIADKIALDVPTLVEKGYADDISCDDLFHAHLYVTGVCDGWCSNAYDLHMDVLPWSEQFIEDDWRIVYHTRERQGPRNPYSGPARSILSTPNGLFVMRSDDDVYHTHGTVHGVEPFLADRKYDGLCSPGSVLVLDDGTTHDLTQILIMPDANGRYTLGEQRFDVFFSSYWLNHRDEEAACMKTPLRPPSAHSPP